MTIELLEKGQEIVSEIRTLEYIINFLKKCEGNDSTYNEIDIDAPLWVNLQYKNGINQQVMGKYIQIEINSLEMLNRELEELKDKLKNLH